MSGTEAEALDFVSWRNPAMAGPARADPLPMSLAELTPAWMTRALSQDFPGAVVSGFREIGVVHGTTTKMRLAIDYADRAGAPASVCVKSNWESHAAKSLGTGIFAMEGHFYAQMRPLLPLPAPRCHFADFDDATGQSVLVMEDIAAAGGTFNTNGDPLSAAAMAVAFDSLAHLHSCWWGDDALAQFAWLLTSMAPGTVDGVMYDVLEPRIHSFAARPNRAAFLPDWYKRDPARLRRLYAALCAWETARTDPRCVIHGDTHLGNSYNDPSGKLCWLDWQLLRRGHAIRDISYFIVGSLTIEERRAHEKDLIAGYLDRLAARGIAAPSFAEAWDEHRRWSIYSLVAWLGTDDAWQKGDACAASTERCFAAIADHDTLALFG